MKGNLAFVKGSFTFVYSIVLYSGPCCPWSITLDASADVVMKWPQYFGRYNPTGKIYHRAPVYINKKGLFLFVNQKGAWSVNDLVNELGLLRGTGIGKDGNCVASVTDWALWDIHDWRSANITVSCIQDTRDMADMFPLQSHQSNRMSIIEEEGQLLQNRFALGIVVLLYCSI